MHIKKRLLQHFLHSCIPSPFVFLFTFSQTVYTHWLSHICMYISLSVFYTTIQYILIFFSFFCSLPICTSHVFVFSYLVQLCLCFVVSPCVSSWHIFIGTILRTTICIPIYLVYEADSGSGQIIDHCILTNLNSNNFYSHALNNVSRGCILSCPGKYYTTSNV